MIKQKYGIIEAIADLKTQENKLTSTTRLAERWNWKHHTRVLRLLKKLEEKKLIEKKSSKQGTVIQFK